MTNANSKTLTYTTSDPTTHTPWWHIRCSCGWADHGYTTEQIADMAAIVHRLAQHTDDSQQQR